MERDPTTREVMDAVLELRNAVSTGFARVDSAFAKVEDEIRALDARLEDFRNDFNRRFILVYDKFDKIDERFDRIDARFDQMDLRFDGLDHRVERLETRLAI